MKVFLDDERAAPAGWARVHTAQEAIAILKTGKVTEISLDHDLGDDAQGTGNDVLLWIEKEVFTHDFDPPTITVHTANPSARKKMEAGVESILRIYAGIRPGD